MKIGQKFRGCGSEYTLVQIHERNRDLVTYLDHVTDQVLINPAVEVDNLYNITEEEFASIMGIAGYNVERFTDMDGNPLFPELFSVGDRFFRDGYRGEEYMLVYVNGLHALVNINRGNGWSEGVDFDCWDITKDQLNRITGGYKFTKIDNK